MAKTGDRGGEKEGKKQAGQSSPSPSGSEPSPSGEKGAAPPAGEVAGGQVAVGRGGDGGEARPGESVPAAPGKPESPASPSAESGSKAVGVAKGEPAAQENAEAGAPAGGPPSRWPAGTTVALATAPAIAPGATGEPAGVVAVEPSKNGKPVVLAVPSGRKEKSGEKVGEKGGDEKIVNAEGMKPSATVLVPGGDEEGLEKSEKKAALALGPARRKPPGQQPPRVEKRKRAPAEGRVIRIEARKGDDHRAPTLGKKGTVTGESVEPIPDDLRRRIHTVLRAEDVRVEEKDPVARQIVPQRYREPVKTLLEESQ